jgi:hypothetical protein
MQKSGDWLSTAVTGIFLVLKVCTIHLEFDRIGLAISKKDNVHDNRG